MKYIPYIPEQGISYSAGNNENEISISTNGLFDGRNKYLIRPEFEKEDLQASFVCMYADPRKGIAAASDGCEVTRAAKKKIILDQKKELIIGFSDYLVNATSRTEAQIRKTLDEYTKEGIKVFLQLMDNNLSYLENVTGLTNVIIGYLDRSRFPLFASYEILKINDNAKRTITTGIMENCIAIGRNAEIISQINENTYADIEEQARHTVEAAIVLENLRPEKHRSVGGGIFSEFLRI